MGFIAHAQRGQHANVAFRSASPARAPLAPTLPLRAAPRTALCWLFRAAAGATFSTVVPHYASFTLLPFICTHLTYCLLFTQRCTAGADLPAAALSHCLASTMEELLFVACAG